ncbi:MAG TPA: NADPH:quinone oxidoreductase family protein [Acidimicrobiales bacterium]|nr:NADPH:quinone oxidoreductase family protein [Acidimicrobiales bacterium]
MTDVDAPEAGDGQVRVRVEASAVNFPDVLLVAGEYQVKVEPPFVPGSEFAGVVVDTGARVFGSALVGAFADEIVVAPTSVTPIPDGVDSATAAAFGVAHRTAYHVLRSVATVQAGERVVVLGAGGGVGLAAVQLAAHLGAEAIAVASSDEKLAVARTLGAAHTVNHRDGDLRAGLGQNDVVVDPVGGDLSEPALRSLRPGGRFVTVGFASGTIPRIPLNLVLLKGITIAGFQFLDFATRHPHELRRNEDELLALLRDGHAVPHIGARFGLDDAAAALRYVADGRAIGKVVIDVA